MYECTIDQELAEAAAEPPGRRCVHSPGGNTFLCEMTLWSPSWNYGLISKIQVTLLWLKC